MLFRQIKDIGITKTTAEDGDLLILQNPTTGETYNITKADFLAGLSSGGGSTSEVPLTFSSSGDTNGLFFYIGTDGRTQAWQNPHNNGVVISSSTVGSGTFASLVDRQASEFYTNNDSNAWVKISLESGKLKCNYYSLRNRSNTNYYLRNWKLQGSNDDASWVDIDTQTNNTSLNSPSQWLSIPVNNTAEAFSTFRLLHTGLDSTGYNFICLGEIELYGVLEL